MPAMLLREQYCNQFPNAKVKMSKTFNIDLPKGPRGSFEAHYNVEFEPFPTSFFSCFSFNSKSVGRAQTVLYNRQLI